MTSLFIYGVVGGLESVEGSTASPIKDAKHGKFFEGSWLHEPTNALGSDSLTRAQEDVRMARYGGRDVAGKKNLDATKNLPVTLDTEGKAAVVEAISMIADAGGYERLSASLFELRDNPSDELGLR